MRVSYVARTRDFVDTFRSLADRRTRRIRWVAVKVSPVVAVLFMVASGTSTAGSGAPSPEFAAISGPTPAKQKEVGNNDFLISHPGPDGNTSFIVDAPKVAYNSRNKEYLVVWWGNDTGTPMIFGQRVALSGTLIGDSFQVNDNGGGWEAPAVAYNSTNNEYLVVWKAHVSPDTEIYGQRLSASGAELGTNDARLSDMGPDGNINFYALRPAVAHASIENEYLVVWRGHDDPRYPPDVSDIFGQLLAPTLLDVFIAWFDNAPVVAYGRHYLQRGE